MAQVFVQMRRLMEPGIAHRNRASRHGLKNGEELSFSQSWMSKASGLEQTHYGDMEARRKQVLAADERRSTLIQKQFVTCHPVQISAHLRSSAANRSSPWPPCLRGGIKFPFSPLSTGKLFIEPRCRC